MHLYDYTVCVLVHVSMRDCACDYIITSQCSVSLWVICWGLIACHMRIWAGGCLVHTTPMASNDISFILQAQSCSLHDESSSFSLKPFCHTTHIEGLYMKMRSIVFSHAHKLTVEWWEWLLTPTSIHLSPVTLSLEWKEAASVCFFNIHFFSFFNFLPPSDSPLRSQDISLLQCFNSRLTSMGFKVIHRVSHKTVPMHYITNIHGKLSLMFKLKSTTKVALIEFLTTLTIFFLNKS